MKARFSRFVFSAHVLLCFFPCLAEEGMQIVCDDLSSSIVLSMSTPNRSGNMRIESIINGAPEQVFNHYSDDGWYWYQYSNIHFALDKLSLIGNISSYKYDDDLETWNYHSDEVEATLFEECSAL